MDRENVARAGKLIKEAMPDFEKALRRKLGAPEPEARGPAASIKKPVSAHGEDSERKAGIYQKDASV